MYNFLLSSVAFSVVAGVWNTPRQTEGPKSKEEKKHKSMNRTITILAFSRKPCYKRTLYTIVVNVTSD